VLPAAQATLEIGAKILAGGVHARRVMSSALGACRHRVGVRAGSMPACRRPDADFAQHGEARSGTQAPVAAPFAVGAACAAPDALECADSFGAPEMREAMSTACASARPGPIAARVDDGSQEGAITLHDVKDRHHAVLDVVKGVVTEHGSATAPDTRRCRFCIRPNGIAAESRFQRCP
jgi:hypothetical protein